MSTPHQAGRTAALLAFLALSIAAPAPASAGAAQRTVTCDGQVATVTGTPGHDVLTGTPGDDVVAGLGGHDVVRGLGGDDLICGGAKRDHIFGGAGDDTLRGGHGKDVIHGGSGNDLLVGGPGLDLEYGGAGLGDRLLGNDGPDLLSDTGDGGVLSGDRGNDELRAVGPSRLVGGRGFDGLFAEACGCFENGGPGRDSLIAVAGGTRPAQLLGGHGRDDVDLETDVRPDDLVRGGGGHDQLILTFDRRPGQPAPYRRVVVDLSARLVQAGASRMPITSFSDIEIDGYTGTHGTGLVVSRAFTLVGSGGRNTLDAEIGGSFSPTFDLFGRGGDDTLLGGAGNDLLVGGPGHDRGDGREGRDVCRSVEAGAEGVARPCEVVRR